MGWTFPINNNNFLENLETTVQCRNGEKKIISWNTRGMTDETGGISGYIAIGLDISGRREAEEAVKSANAYHRGLIEASLDPLVTISPEGKITDVNEATIRATGVSRDILIGSDFSGYFTEPDKAAAGYRKVLADGSVRDYPLTLLHRSGTTMDVLYHASVYRNRNGELLGVFAAARDITERKKVEEAVRQVNAYHRGLIETSLDPFVTIGPDGKITDANVATEVATGHLRKQLIGTDFSDYFTEPEKARAGYLQVFREGQVRDYPLVLRHREGHVTPVLYNATVYRDESGNVMGVFAAARDITGLIEEERKLKESEEKFRLLYENSMDAIFLTSTDGSIQTANPAACAMLQRTEDEIIQLGRAGVVDTTDPRLPAAIQEWERTGRFEGELTFVRKDKQRFPGEITSSVFADRNGQKRTSMIVRDITDRKRFEEKLQQGIDEKTATIRESELRHRLLFESSQDAIMTLEPPDWRFTSGNPTSVAMFRAKDEAEFTSASPWDLSPEFQPGGRPSGEKAKEQIEKAVREGSNYFEWTHRRLTGDEFPATVLFTRFEWKGKEILQATVRDISGQKHAEEERRKSERKFRAIFDQTFQFIGLLTPEGILVEANRTALEFSGIQESDVIGKPFWETPWWTHSGELQEKLRAAVLDAAKGEFVRFEATHIAADGHLHYVDFSLKPVKDEAGHVILLIPEGRDISEQKHAEDKIKASLDEKVLLLREIHHRVKNNLQIIISLVNLQMRQIDDERLKQVMAETQNRVRAMAFVHEKLYRSEDISHIDLANYTRLLVTRLFSFYGMDSRQVALKIDIGTIMVSINTAIPLGLIINELASNALKHAFCGGRKGTLSIAVRKEDRTLYLTVKSDGVGIPEDFDWRNAESLGLRLVISLVDQLDGTIELDRSAGTAFTIVMQEKE